MANLVIRSSRVITPAGMKAASVHVEAERITQVGEYDGPATQDFGDLVVMPGLVDSHVHLNEPGRTEWEGFETGTRAAAAGGVTTLIDMPLNSVPATTTVSGLEAKRAAARGKLWADVGFWGGVVPGNRGELRGLQRAGVLGFKCFLAPSGVPEFPCVCEADLREAMPVLAELGVVLLVHAEMPAQLQPVRGDARKYANYLASRPRESEQEAISMMIRLSRCFGVRVHIVHLSSSDALGLFGDPLVTVETCPHYLTFAAEEIADGATEYKCAPPIRERENREELWQGLIDGTIQLIATDHSPSPPAMKQGDFAQAWGGISSVQHGLAAVWTGMRQRGIPIERIAEWMCDRPAVLAGLSGRKGRIAPGYDADLVVWNPDARADTTRLLYRHQLSPYQGMDLYGRVEAVFLRGTLVTGPAGCILPNS